MSAIVKFYSTVSSKLSELSVVDGQLIFVTDTKQIYLDNRGLRLGYNDIQVLPSDSSRQEMLAPVEGFYFVEDTNILWRYHGEWKQISPTNVEPLFFGDRKDFPQTGNSKVLYLSSDAVYHWDDLSQTYIIIANKLEWKRLGD